MSINAHECGLQIKFPPPFSLSILGCVGQEINMKNLEISITIKLHYNDIHSEFHVQTNKKSCLEKINCSLGAIRQGVSF